VGISKNYENPFIGFTTIPMIPRVVLFSGSVQSKRATALYIVRHFTALYRQFINLITVVPF